MSKHASLALALAAVLAASGCATLVPAVPPAEPGIPAAWPLPETTRGDAGVAATPAALPMADVGWRDAWLALASDQGQLRLAESALGTYERTLALTSQRQAVGATSALEVEQVRTQVEGTRSDGIGAARAAFFPSISLTGSVGSASDELSGLFDGGTRIWSFMPQINLPIFQGGRLRAGLGVARAERDIALAQADALARQVRAREALVDAATRAESLAQARHDAGLDSSLVRLDAQRTLYSTQQALVATRMAEQRNRVTLYKVFGGGWREHSTVAAASRQ